MKRPRLGLTSLTHTMRILIQWGFPRMGVPKNGFCLRENPIKMDINGWFGAWGYPHFRKPPNQTYAKHQFAESQRGSKRRRKNRPTQRLPKASTCITFAWHIWHWEKERWHLTVYTLQYIEMDGYVTSANIGVDEWAFIEENLVLRCACIGKWFHM